MLSQFWGQDEFWQGTLVEKCSQVDGCGEFSSSYFSPCFGPSEFEFSVPLSPACLCIPGDSPAFPGCPWQGSCPTPSWRSCSGATRAPRGGVMCAAVVSCPQSSLTALSLSAGISPRGYTGQDHRIPLSSARSLLPSSDPVTEGDGAAGMEHRHEDSEGVTAPGHRPPGWFGWDLKSCSTHCLGQGHLP